MEIMGGFDLHRHQITYDYLDTGTDEVRRGEIRPACRAELAEFLEQFAGRDTAFAVEGCTGWWFVVDELARAGIEAHVADPAELAGRRSPKKRAKTDRTDARRAREALTTGELPESWIPPAHMVDTRAWTRLYMDLVVERDGWAKRIHATMFHHGAPPLGRDLTTPKRRAAIEKAAADLPPGARHAVIVALDAIAHANTEISEVRSHLASVARRQPACRALQEHIYGIGPLTAPIIWTELGDCRRFSSSAQAVRHSGLDITVWSSDGKRTRGRLARQGPGVLRWALYEAAMTATRRSSPDHDYYLQVKTRCGHGRATLSVARKICRRSHHLLRTLGDDALAPPP